MTIMSLNRAVVVLIAGFTLMVGSGIGGFYWAIYPTHRPRFTPESSPSTEKKSLETTQATSESRTDSVSLTPQNWEAFLNYEGTRKRMLGVEKKYPSVNLRSGPGMEHPILSTPSGGSLLKPLDRVGNWYRCRLRDGTLGWIHKSIIRVLRVPEPIYREFEQNLPPLKRSTKERIPDELKKHSRVKIRVNKVNLRRGPGTQFNVIGQLYKFQEARLLGKQKKWYRVKTPTGSTGWVYDELVQPVWRIKKSSQPAVKINTDDLRMGPEYQFRKPIPPMESHITARLLERQQPWFLVKINEKNIGWVHEKEINR